MRYFYVIIILIFLQSCSENSKRCEVNGTWKDITFYDRQNDSIIFTFQNNILYECKKYFEGSLYRKFEFYNNGLLKLLWLYSNDTIKILQWWNNGKMMAYSQSLYNGVEIGCEIYFDYEGKVYEYGKFNDLSSSVLVDTFQTKEKDGFLYKREKDGVWKYYNQKKELTKIVKYSNGIIIDSTIVK